MNATAGNHTSANVTDMYDTQYMDINEDINLLEKILCSVLLPMTCGGGIVSIILTMVVLCRKKMCTSTNCYLTALAVTDLCFLVLLSTSLVGNRFVNLDLVAFYKFHIYVDYMNIFLQLFNLTSVWLTVMLSIERYIAICHPLRAASLSTVSGARKVIVIIYIIAFLCGLPKFWEIKVASVQGFAFIKRTDLSTNPDYILTYGIIYEGLLTAVLPFLFLVTINSRLIQEIHKSTRYLRHHLAAGSVVCHVISAEQLQLTLMLIGITAVFFLCHAPYVVYTVINVMIKYTLEPDSSFINAFHTFRPISLLLLAAKSAVNFILYCWFSEKFRMTFKRLFCMPNCLTRPQMRRLSNNSHYHTRRNSYHISKETTC